MVDTDINFWSEIVFPVAMFVLGFLIRHFTMSKAEKSSHGLALQRLSNDLLVEKDKRFEEFVLAMKDYAAKADKPDLEDFCNVAQTGEAYFASMTMICDSILSGNIDQKTACNTYAHAVADTIQKSLPSYYEALQEIAKKEGINYKGKLEREKYVSIFKAHEMFTK